MDKNYLMNVGVIAEEQGSNANPNPNHSARHKKDTLNKNQTGSK